jgi:hypothetical protein
MRKPIGLLDANRYPLISKVRAREKRGRLLGQLYHADSLICLTCPTKTCFCALTGKNRRVGGTLENAQAMTAHESQRATKLYDRTADVITLDDSERIVI